MFYLSVVNSMCCACLCIHAFVCNKFVFTTTIRRTYTIISKSIHYPWVRMLSIMVNDCIFLLNVLDAFSNPHLLSFWYAKHFLRCNALTRSSGTSGVQELSIYWSFLHLSCDLYSCLWVLKVFFSLCRRPGLCWTIWVTSCTRWTY